MKILRTRLTFANVTSCLALFVALGGASYAATQLPKNSVGTKQLKNKSVTGAKIKNGAVTGAKIKLSTLGTVPSATNATNATNAANATNAQHAQIADAIQAPEALHLVGEPGEPQFAPTWGNFSPEYSAVAFYKDREDVVHIQGTASGKNTKNLVFTLPPGYRPAKIQTFAAVGDADVPIVVNVFGEGEVFSGDKSLAFLNGITFRAES